MDNTDHAGSGDAGVDLHFVSAQTWPLRSYTPEGDVLITQEDLPAYTWLGARVGYRAFEDRLELAERREADRDADGGGLRVSGDRRSHLA